MGLRAIRSAIGLLRVGAVAARRRRRIAFGEDLVAYVFETRRGGMGVVHLCSFDEDADTYSFALKTFDERFFFDAGMQAAVNTEASSWLQVSGAPFVLPLFDVLEADGMPYLVMPAIPSDDDGVASLADEIARAPGGLGTERVATVALQIATGLASCDRLVPGIVHGDIKPGNVLLLPDGIPQIADFGAARLASLRGAVNRAQGTALYLAPECWVAGDGASQVSDVYAFGAMMRELLTGTPPFVPIDCSITTLERMHRHEEPTCEFDRADVLAEGLAELALHCLRKAPGDRPVDMGAVRARLASIVEDADPLLPTTIIAPGLSFAGLAGDPTFGIRRVRALIERDDAEGALGILDRLPAEAMQGEFLRLRGTALCLAGREEEAVAILEAFLADAPEGDERTRGVNELALVCKRMDRLHDARTLYENEIPRASDEMQPMLRGNYAATLLALGQADRAATILRDLALRNPDLPEAWALLADALLASEARDAAAEAVGAVQRAIGLDAADGRYRVMLAALMMDRFGDVGGAMEALDAAYGTGHQSREWLVRTFACNLLLGRRAHLGELLQLMREGVPEDDANALLDEATSMARRIAEVVEDGPRSGIDGHEGGAGGGRGDPAGAGPPLAIGERGGLTDPAVEVPAPSAAHDAETEVDEDVRARMRMGLVAHVQIRHSMVDGSTLFDFYYGFDRPDFPERFAQAFGAVEVHVMGLTPGGSRRAKPFAFARCPACSIGMLTQRDEGERYGCQGCSDRVLTTLVDDPSLQPLLDSAMKAAGIRIRPTDGGTLFLAVFPTIAQDVSQIGSMIEEGGYRRVAPDVLGHRMMAKEAAGRGVPAPAGLLLWMREIEPGSSVAVDGTPGDLDRLLRYMRRRVGPLVTLSTSASPEMAAVMLEREDQLFSRMVENDLSDDPASGRSAVEAAVRLGRTDDARRLLSGLRLGHPDDPDTLAAVAAVDLAQGRPEEAIALLEEVLERRPRDHGARVSLAVAYRETGRSERFEEMLDELRGHGVLRDTASGHLPEDS